MRQSRSTALFFLILGASAISFCLPASVFAEPAMDAANQHRHQGSIGFEGYPALYNEPGLMKNTGIFWGVSGDYIYRPNSLSFKVEGRFAAGTIDYTSIGSGIVKGIKDYSAEIRFLVGYSRRISKRFTFTEFAGLGYRYLLDGKGSTMSDTGAKGYDRKSHYLYIPLGEEFSFRFARSWELALTGEYDFLWHGWQYSENFASLGYTIKNDQTSGKGARGSIKLSRRFKRIGISIEPFIRYWSIGDSDHALIMLVPPYPFIYEPANKTTERGARLAINF
jgi:hypothetical protein